MQVNTILLTTLNAKYVHTSLGLRYLYANMGELQSQTQLKEYNINLRIEDIVENIVTLSPDIIGFGIYIWNINETLATISMLKQILPNVIIILGGPEVSYETENQAIVQAADYVICGTADLAFAKLCKQIKAQQIKDDETPENKIIHSEFPHLNNIKLPYQFYSDEDIAYRLIYVEASRGCPFKCEFCLSALDKTSKPFELENFMNELETLYQRGARRFKFVDRTFNLKVQHSQIILKYFLAKIDQGDEIFVHFEIIPDRLPEELKQLLTGFPVGSLQFEVGIQTFNPAVQALISRKQNHPKTIANLSWLRENTSANIHTDLIVGLPGEDWNSFAKGFNELYQCRPQEIQVGILKRLKGTPIIRHTEQFKLVFNQQAPFNILSTSCLSYIQIRELERFARFWEIIANSGRFILSLPLLIDNDPFHHFYQISHWIYRTTGLTHKFSLKRLFDLLYSANQNLRLAHRESLFKALAHDYQNTALKGRPDFMKT
ncbi:MAG: DUF4080 domain-containing protein [Gammaproteobacteria bacterium]|nr:DUF4080 domain-containing protein [Gammaproteobacteria bacterium]